LAQDEGFSQKEHAVSQFSVDGGKAVLPLGEIELRIAARNR